ncbi:hypothetical protein F5Y14DRAFT_415956 [Nemania sp. NC0429]|nr:hypothetical protein F5Y14DRAFT_415956 [Nemania sp. NC0429]
MTSKTSHFFQSLPSELRCIIYMLATPPRIVHVQEGRKKDYDAFLEEFLTTPNELKVDPTIAHFAFNWKDDIPSRAQQRTLESFGFSSARRPADYPWQPSPSTPEIPLAWLSENPEVAWILTRESYLFSKAPIPALLHMCAESRAELTKQGYELAFRTRSSEPRTWFNFRRDVLFLACDENYDWDDRWLLSGGRWDVGQFHPTDMQRVRKLALEGSAEYLDGRHRREALRQVSPIPRLFRALEELLLVEWTMKDLVRMWPVFIFDAWMGPREQRESQDGIAAAGKYWQSITLEDLQAILCSFPPQGFWCHLSAVRPGRIGLYSRVDWENPDDIPNVQSALEQELVDHRNRITASDTGDPAASWNIPKIKAALVLPRSIVELFSPERLMLVEELIKRTEWERWWSLWLLLGP